MNSGSADRNAASDESSGQMPEATKPINILFVLPVFDTGGSEKLVIDIIRHLDPSRFNPVLVVLFGGQHETTFRKLGLPFYVIHEQKTRSKWATAALLRRIVREHRIDVVNTHHPSPLIQGFVPFRVLSRVKWIHTEHTRLDLEPDIHDRALSLCRMVLKSVDVCVGISQSVCMYFEEELDVPRRRIRKILNGVDISRFELTGFDREAFRAPFISGTGTLLVGMFANFRPQKNHVNFVRAIRLLKDQGVVNFRVLLCGDGPTLPEVKTLIAELDVGKHVQILGPRFDIPQLMNAIDIYCLPSRFEGLPLSLLEAMACRRAIVATEVSGNDEVVVDGENGLFCNDDDPVDLARKLERLLTDPALRAQLGARAFETARQLSYQSMMRAYDTLFTEVVA